MNEKTMKKKAIEKTLMKKDEKCMMVLFGATGDLTKRKLMPALFRLYQKGFLNKSTPIACIGRRPISRSEFMELLNMSKFIPEALKKPSFLKLIHYHQIDFESKSHSEFIKFTKSLESKYNCTGNKIFYLAMPPTLFGPTIHILDESGILKGKGWKRVVFEKPFGRDLKSARALNKQVSSVFKEEQIYRIDHYLGKELVQNIMVFRFANSIFEQIWSRKFIDHVQITIAETDGVGSRAGYYEKSGAIRDMLQNHALQVLAMIAMESPLTINADDIRDMKVQVMKALRPLDKNDLVLGQYSDGVIEKKKVKGYRKEPNVNPKSNIETYSALKLHIDNPRWQGVPFFIRSGKRMASKYAEVNLILKDVTCNLFCTEEVVESPNIITIRIQPNEGIAIKFNSKFPGAGVKIHPVVMDFCHTCLFGLNTPEAYETLLHEIMTGDQTLFTRWDEVEYSWRYVDPILKLADNLRKKIPKYKSGTFGPKQADELLRRNDRSWLPQGE